MHDDWYNGEYVPRYRGYERDRREEHRYERHEEGRDDRRDGYREEHHGHGRDR